MPPEDSTEVVDNQVEGTDEDFDAGFTDAPAPPTETPEKQDGQDETSAAAAPAAAPAAPEYVQITKEEFEGLKASAAAVEELRTTLTQNSDKAFGKIGGIERLIRELQNTTPAGEAVELSEEDMAEFAAEYPELATMQRTVFNKALSKIKLRGTGTGEAFDPAKLEEMVAPRIDTALKGVDDRVEYLVESRLLSREHPDWREVVDAGKPDSKNAYRTWLATQPAEYQKLVNSTFDSSVISEALTKFKAAEKAKATASQRQSRIDAAVTPRGVGGHAAAPSEDDDFNEGFRSG